MEAQSSKAPGAFAPFKRVLYWAANIALVLIILGLLFLTWLPAIYVRLHPDWMQ